MPTPRQDTSPDTALRTHGLCKDYGSIQAVVGLDLDVRRGEIYAFLGPNGAGKTTTIRMLLGLVRPTAGAGHPPGRSVLRRAATTSSPAWATWSKRPRPIPISPCARTWTSSGGSRGHRARRWAKPWSFLACPVRPIGRRASYRWATNSGWRWRAPCSTAPSYSSSMNRPMGLIRPGSSRCASCCGAWRTRTA